MTNSTIPILDDDAIAELAARDVCDHNCAMLTPIERDALCATVRAEREAHMVTVENLQETLASLLELRRQFYVSYIAGRT